jgi:hypothetical protein
MNKRTKKHVGEEEERVNPRLFVNNKRQSREKKGVK